MIYLYQIILGPLNAADGGGWFAKVPELPGCASDGETPQEALDNVMNAISCWLEAARADGRPIPAPGVLAAEAAGASA
jgi:antitoxin HicB